MNTAGKTDVVAVTAVTTTKTSTIAPQSLIKKTVVSVTSIKAGSVLAHSRTVGYVPIAVGRSTVQLVKCGNLKTNNIRGCP